MGRIRIWIGVVIGMVAALLIGAWPWLGMAQPSPDPSEPTPSPRMEDFQEFQVVQFAKVVALVFLSQQENPEADVELFRQQTIRACGLSPDLYEQMNYVFTGDPDFLYVVTRQISQIPEGELQC